LWQQKESNISSPTNVFGCDFGVELSFPLPLPFPVLLPLPLFLPVPLLLRLSLFLPLPLLPFLSHYLLSVLKSVRWCSCDLLLCTFDSLIMKKFCAGTAHRALLCHGSGIVSLKMLT